MKNIVITAKDGLRLRIAKAGYSITEFAMKTGTSHQTIFNAIAGKNVCPHIAKIISDTLETTTEELFDFSEVKR